MATPANDCYAPISRQPQIARCAMWSSLSKICYKATLRHVVMNEEFKCCVKKHNMTLPLLEKYEIIFGRGQLLLRSAGIYAIYGTGWVSYLKKGEWRDMAKFDHFLLPHCTNCKQRKFIFACQQFGFIKEENPPKKRRSSFAFPSLPPPPYQVLCDSRMLHDNS